LIRTLTRAEVPDGSLIGWVSDSHIGIEHTPALKLMCEAWEWAGVTHIVPGGDILDMHCFSSHEKDPDAPSKLLEEVESGRWLLNYFATRPAYFLLGNHEDRLRRWMVDNAMQLFGNPAMDIRQLAGIPAGIEILPQGSEIRLGNLVLEHLDATFKKSTGGKYPAQKLLEMAPDQSTVGGHLHRICQARRTAVDEYGVKRTRAAFIMGHMSREEKHHNYVSKHINWQMGFGMIRVWWEGNRPRFSVYQVEVLFDRKGRPYFEMFGRVFQGGAR
jgi:hypothetical protein